MKSRQLSSESLAFLKPLVGLAVMVLFVSFLSPQFLTFSNLLNVLRQTSINTVIAAGMTFVILTGGIDLSVGSILAFCGALGAFLLNAGDPIAVALPAALLAGLLFGSVSGVIITKGRVQPFIATFVAMTLLRGATLVFTDGQPLNAGSGDLGDAFAFLGQGYVLGLPFPVLIMGAVVVLVWYVLTQTRFGRYVYAIGGNEKAAHLSGLHTDRIKIVIYGLSGLLAALAGLILTSRLSSAQPTAGTGYELDAIAAVVIGGTSLAGGRGSMVGTLIGALIIGVLNNALNILNVSAYYQMIAKGLVILIAVLLDRKKN
jgi:ribose transport system permease protein